MMLFAPACDEAAHSDVVDFTSDGAAAVRASACAQPLDVAARKGAAAETFNASILWSVSPYLILIPSTGVGHVNINIDAAHFDWLIYTTSDVDITTITGPQWVYNGPVQECPERGLVEYGVHHSEAMLHAVALRAAPLSRVFFYAGLAPTDHSDLNSAGHAGHTLTGDGQVPSHSGH